MIPVILFSLWFTRLSVILSLVSLCRCKWHDFIHSGWEIVRWYQGAFPFSPSFLDGHSSLLPCLGCCKELSAVNTGVYLFWTMIFSGYRYFLKLLPLSHSVDSNVQLGEILEASEEGNRSVIKSGHIGEYGSEAVEKRVCAEGFMKWNKVIASSIDNQHETFGFPFLVVFSQRYREHVENKVLSCPQV